MHDSVRPWVVHVTTRLCRVNTFTAQPLGTALYVSVVVVAGAAALLQSCYDLRRFNRARTNWVVLAVLTLSKRVRDRYASVAARDYNRLRTFVFTSVLVVSARAAGTLTVALDALVISFWSYRKGHPLYKDRLQRVRSTAHDLGRVQLFFLQADIQPLFDPQAADPLSIDALIPAVRLSRSLIFS